MSTPLPVIRGASTALYPFTQTYVAHTGVSDAQNGSTARWVQDPPTVRFEFGYNPLTRVEKNTLKSAFDSMKGQFETDLTATTDQLYSNLSQDADEFSAVEQRSTKYGVRWALTQVVAQNFSPGASGGAYPLLSTNAIGQLPYMQKRRYQTIIAAAGIAKYTYAQFAAGLTNFPTTALMGWEFDEGQLTDAEVNMKVAHWLANWGNCYPFTFTDEDGTTYSKV